VSFHSTGGPVGREDTTTGRVTRSDPSGRFRLAVPAATPGRLALRAVGHVEQSVRVPALRPGRRHTVAITLPPLYESDVLAVVAERRRPLLNTEDATTGGSIERREVAALPTNGRDPLDQTFTIPGVAQSSGFFGDAPPLSINGANGLQTQYLIDGLDNNEGFLGGPRIEFPISALARTEVKSSTFSARYGRTTSGVVNYETRSGGEEWEAEVFGAWRPGTPVDADPKFAPAGTDPDGFRRIHVGGAAGGPLREDRTFFFGAVEYENEQEDRIGSTARTDFVGTEVRETTKLFGRIDHGWRNGQTTTLQFAYSDVTREGQGGGIVTPEADVTTVRRGSLTALTHRSSLGEGRGGNEFTVQVGTFRWDFPPSESDLDTPRVTILGPDGTVPQAVVGSSNFVFDESELQLQIRDVLEAELGGGHTLRAGGDVIVSSFDLFAANTNPNGHFFVVDEGNIEASGRFLSIDDVPDGVRVRELMIDSNPTEVDRTQTNVGLFLEDQWRVTPSLTVRGGLRWDYDDITSRGESDPDLDNVQPRLSVNWNVTPESVIRAGGGLYTGKFPYTIFSDAVQFGPEGNATVRFADDTEFEPPAFGEAPSQEELRGLRDRLPPREIRRTFALGLEQPFSYQASLGYQRRFGDSWGISVDGVAVLTRNLPRSFDLNAIQRDLMPGDTVDRSPEFGDRFRPEEPEPGSFRRLTTTESGGKSRYLGLYTTVRRRVGDSFSAEATWELASFKTDAEDINFNATVGNDFGREWAHGINDRRHHLTARGVYRVDDRLTLAGIADFQTGTPINRVAFFRDLDGSGPVFGEGFVGNFDRFPGVERNSERLPSEFRLDLTLEYLVPFVAGDLKLRTEVFNVFNSTLSSGLAEGIPGGGPRTQTGRPGDPTEFTTAGPARQFQFTASYLF